ncbi:MAG TPA: hypothetical protein VJ810_21605 [Blastocatellia bacterium]|nr:hypothetical protein [Blastocatellia bacterium]
MKKIFASLALAAFMLGSVTAFAHPQNNSADQMASSKKKSKKKHKHRHTTTSAKTTTKK